MEESSMQRPLLRMTALCQTSVAELPDYSQQQPQKNIPVHILFHNNDLQTVTNYFRLFLKQANISGVILHYVQRLQNRLLTGHMPFVSPKKAVAKKTKMFLQLAWLRVWYMLISANLRNHCSLSNYNNIYKNSDIISWTN